MTLSQDVERQLSRIYDRIRDVSTIGVGEPIKFMAQVEIYVGDSADSSSIIGMAPLVHMNHDGSIKLVSIMGRNPDIYIENQQDESSPSQECGEHYNNL